MKVYYMNSYDIIDLEKYQQYGPLAVPLIIKYGGEVLAADTEGIAVEGNSRTMNAIIRFPSEEAALNCYNDPEYQQVKKIRIGATTNCTMILVKHFSQE
ncbi:MAG: DUF1330 domain-containing protein [Chitinophagaceae bacterium]|nr:DUF1330 domain-containing protein [Chitinophagaceae bacterium]